MKSQVRLSLMLFLLVGFLLNANSSVALDIIPPNVDSYWFDRPTATVGETVTVVYNVTDNLNQLNYVYSELYWWNSTGNYGMYMMGLWPNNDSGNTFWQAQFVVDLYWPSGSYYIDYIYAEDSDANSIYAYSGTDFPVVNLEIIGTTPDYNAPTVNNLWFNKPVAGPNDKISLLADVTDDISGVAWVYVSISWWNSSGNHRGVTSGYMDRNGTNYQFDLYVGQYWLGGIYFVDFIQAYDNSGNGVYYYNSSSQLPIAELNVIDTTPDFKPPTLQNIWFSQTSAGPNSAITVMVNISDDVSGVSYVDLDISWFNKTGRNEFYVTSVYLEFNPVSAYFEGQFLVGQYWRNGTYYVSNIWSGDFAFNDISWQNNTDYTSPLLDIQGTTPDFDPPVFLDFWTTTNATGIDSFFDVFVQASDDLSGVSFGYVYFYYYDPSSDSWNYATEGYLEYDDQLGLMTGKIWVPDDVILVGNRIVSSFLEICDTAGNCLYLDGLNNEFDMISIEILERQIPQGFNLNLDPSIGSSNVGQQVLFNLQMENTYSRGMDAKLNIEVIGPESYPIVENTIWIFLTGEIRETSFEIRFDFSGDYQITASLEDEEAKLWKVTSNWRVNDGIASEISLSVDPQDEVSKVNETIEFAVLIKSTFEYDMVAVTIFLKGSHNNGETFSERKEIDVLGNSEFREIFEVTFNLAGDYNLKLILTDDIGKDWILEFRWSVSDGPNGNDGGEGGTADPEISLPGFEFPMAILSLIGIMTFVTARRRRIL